MGDSRCRFFLSLSLSDDNSDTQSRVCLHRFESLCIALHRFAPSCCAFGLLAGCFRRDRAFVLSEDAGEAFPPGRGGLRVKQSWMLYPRCSQVVMASGTQIESPARRLRLDGGRISKLLPASITPGS